MNENAYVKMHNGLSIFDMEMIEAKKDKPVCGDCAKIVLNALNVIGHDRSVSEVGLGRVKYETIRNYHEDFRVKLPIAMFVRLVQLADSYWLKKNLEK